MRVASAFTGAPAVAAIVGTEAHPGDSPDLCSGSPCWPVQRGLMDGDRSGRATANRRRVGRFVVRGEFGSRLAAALPECEIAVLAGETHITARVRDEAELFGILERLRDLGAAIVSVAIDP